MMCKYERMTTVTRDKLDICINSCLTNKQRMIECWNISKMLFDSKEWVWVHKYGHMKWGKRTQKSQQPTRNFLTKQSPCNDDDDYNSEWVLI